MAKPVCFMVMPYGERETGVTEGRGPEKVNFNALWERVFQPTLTELGYEPVRADQDLGALIIKEMLERLTIADLVVAEVSLPNPNVYYEVGIRHAAKETGCVLLAADWSKQLFDISQMPHLKYSLVEGEITAKSATSIMNILKRDLLTFVNGQSPVYQAVPGYPDNIDPNKTTSFRDFANQLARFQGNIKAIRLTSKEERKTRVLDLLKIYPPSQPLVPAISIELLYAVRDYAGWQATLDYIKALPKELSNLPLIQEQRYLALSKTGNHADALAALEVLVEQFGDSSERQGLMGGRSKKLYQESKNESDRKYYLNLAIEHYEKGMMLDLNDYYPSCNLPRLYRIRAESGDESRARNAAVVAMKACERTLLRNPNHPWIRPTLLGAAFDTGDVVDAQKLQREIQGERFIDWRLETTLKDLETSIKLHKDPEIREELEKILLDLKALI